MEFEEIVVGPAAGPAQNELYLADVMGDAALLGMDSVHEKDAAFQQMYRYVEDMQRLLRERAINEAELRDARRETLFRLAMASEMKNVGEIGHMIRVGLLAATVAHRLGLPSAYCDRLSMAAPLRNIGKVGTASLGNDDPDCQHAEIGAAILGGSDSAELQMAEHIARTHHEHYDGSGKPAGLSARDIPLSGRIVAVAAAFDRAMAGESPALMSVERGVQALMSGRGSRFDPTVVDAAIECAHLYPSIYVLVEPRQETVSHDLLAELSELWKRLVRQGTRPD